MRAAKRAAKMEQRALTARLKEAQRASRLNREELYKEAKERNKNKEITAKTKKQRIREAQKFVGSIDQKGPGSLNYKRNYRCKKASIGSLLSAGQEKMMGDANFAYIMHDYDKATRLLVELIRQSPKNAATYKTLGLVHEQTGNYPKATQSFFLGAMLNPSDPDVWTDLARMSKKLANEDGLLQTCYALNKHVRSWSRGNCPVDRYELCNIFFELGEPKRACDGLANLVSKQVHLLGPRTVTVAQVYLSCFMFASPGCVFDLFFCLSAVVLPLLAALIFDF